MTEVYSHDQDRVVGRGANVGSWPSGISAITLFTENLAETKRFYQEVFGLPVDFEDDASAVFDFGDTLINLLKTDAAHELIEPVPVAPPATGARVQFTITVDDVDTTCAELAKRRVGRLRLADLDTDVIGARVEVVADPPHDCVDVADCDHGIDQPLAALAAEVLVRPPHSAEVVRVVRQREVVLRERSGDAETG